MPVSVEYIKKLNDEEKNMTNDEWLVRLEEASKEVNISVETLLYFMEMYTEDYDRLLSIVGSEDEYLEHLAKEMEREQEIIDSAEDPVYGCDPYPEY